MSLIRYILIPALALSLCLFGCAGKRSVQRERAFDLLLLHTNDTHGAIAGVDGKGTSADEASATGGYARFAHYIKKAKTACGKHVLALDAGDQFQGTLFYAVNGWPMMAELNSAMPYDAITLGNHEFDSGCGELAKFLGKSPIPLVAANLCPDAGCPLSKAVYYPYIVRDFQGVKVGVVGLANDEASSLAGGCKDTKFMDAKLALEKAVKELEAKGVTRIVALTHLGIGRDIELAKSVEGVDVVVGGHTHTYLGPKSKEGPYPIVVNSPSGNPVLVVTAKRSAQYLGELLVSFDRKGVVSYWKGGPKELPSSAARDSEVSALVAKYAQTTKKFHATKVGENSVRDMPDGLDLCRQGDCLGGMLTADAMLEYGRPFGANIALCNGGGIRAALPFGAVTRGDVLNIHPFSNKVVLITCKGSEILAALEHGVSKTGGKGPALLQVAGLSYSVNPALPVGKRVSNVLIADSKGKLGPLAPSQKYIVATSDYVAKGKDGFEMLKNCAPVKSVEPELVTLMEEYIHTHSPIVAPATPRISYISGK